MPQSTAASSEKNVQCAHRHVSPSSLKLLSSRSRAGAGGGAAAASDTIDASGATAGAGGAADALVGELVGEALNTTGSVKSANVSDTLGAAANSGSTAGAVGETPAELEPGGADGGRTEAHISQRVA